MNLRVLAALSLALVACAPEPAEPESSAPPSAAAEQVEAARAPVDRCDEIQDAARRLLVGAQRCSEDADCRVGTIYGPCLISFLCPVVLNPAFGVPYIAERVQELSLSYQKRCGDSCPVARCANPETKRAYCDAETKRCKMELRAPEADASAPTAVPGGLDAGT